MQGSEDLRKYLDILNEAQSEQLDEKNFGKKLALGAKGIFGTGEVSAKAFGEMKTLRQAEELYKDWMHVVGRADGRLANDSDSIARFLSKYAKLDSASISKVFVNAGLTDPIVKRQDDDSKEEVEKAAKDTGIKRRAPELQSVANLWDQFKNAKEAGKGEDAANIAKELVNFAADHGDEIEDVVKGLFRNENMGHWISRIERAKAKVGESSSEKFSFLRMLLEENTELSKDDVQKIMTSVAQLMATGDIYSQELENQLAQLDPSGGRGMEGPPGDGTATRAEMNQFIKMHIQNDDEILNIANQLGTAGNWQEVNIKKDRLQVIVWAWLRSYWS